MRVAILHEGHAGKSEDNWLLKKLLELQGLDEGRVSFYGMGSKSNFFKPDYKDYRELLPMIEADQISKVLFIMDADFQSDDGVHGGYDNCLAALKAMSASLGIDGVCEFYICYDPATKEGNLESLLLSTLDDKKKTCINDFLTCSNFKAKGSSKAILNQVYKTAYPEAPYDFEHENFNELKGKLAVLLS